MKFRKALFATTSTVAALMAVSASAQDTGGQAVEEVIVTGSRIVRDGFQQPTPVTVMQTEALQQMAPSNIADGLNQLPQFRGGTSPNAGGGSAGGEVGANLLSLRNLGAQRTLILLDGRRFVPSSEADTVDTNVMPENVMQRVEVVTGGASAAYGSDAVSGVVNFILDKNYTGLKGSVQAGISTYGDAISHRESLAYGTELFGGRGHFIFSGEYSEKEGIGPYDDARYWDYRQSGLVTKAANDINPTLAFVGPTRVRYRDGVSTTAATFGSLITQLATGSSPTAITGIGQNGPAANRGGGLIGTQFGPGGVSLPFIYTNERNTITSSFQHGADGFLDKGNLTTGLERWSVFARGDYDISDNLNFFTEVSYSQTQAAWDQYYSYFYTANAGTIFSGNPFIPANIQTALTAATYSNTEWQQCALAAGYLPDTVNGVATPVAQRASNSANWSQNIKCFKIGRVNSEAMIGATQYKKVLRIAAGFTGNLPNGWGFDAYFNGGDVYSDKANTNVLNNNYFYPALDAIRTTTGQIACAATTPDAQRPATYAGLNVGYDAATAARLAGCTPFNPFGAGSPSAGSIAFTHGDEHRYLDRSQLNAALNINGELGWAQIGYEAPRFAAGIEWRKETIDVTTNLATQQAQDYTFTRGGLTSRQGNIGPFQVGNFQPDQTPGASSYSTREAYLELVLPVFSERPLAHLLDFNGAIRYTEYSNSGGVVTWKLGAVYEPIESLRFRATRSRDIRGPSADDLFGGVGQGIGTTANPFGGGQISWTSRVGGNPNLVPEEADTTTYGIVFQPTFFPGFNASIDFYNIEIKQGIGSVSTTTIFNQCAASASTNFDSPFCAYITQSPGLLIVNATLINLTNQKISGFDFELGYARDIGPGRLSTRALLVYQDENITETPGVGVGINAAGAINSNNPLWTGNIQVAYNVGPLGISLQERLISRGNQDNQWVTGVDIDDNRVPMYYLTDLNLRYKFGEDERLEGFLSVQNLFNRDPPFAPGNSGIRQRWTNKDLYDVIGRYMTVGIRFRL